MKTAGSLILMTVKCVIRKAVRRTVALPAHLTPFMSHKVTKSFFDRKY